MPVTHREGESMDSQDSLPNEDNRLEPGLATDEAQPSEMSSSEASTEIDPFAFAEKSSQPFVGQWNKLVSRTNWDKGRIIQEWRDSLLAEDAPATAYSDEAWSRLVGGVTSQHVGRLRRVYQRFGDVYESYLGLYWTHFQAALDWDDAEMWLEGAKQSQWSVAQMRRTRWETMGGAPDQQPRDEDIVEADLDEDFEPALEKKPDAAASGDEDSEPRTFDESQAGPRAEGPDFGDEEHLADRLAETSESEIDASDLDDEAEAVELVRPFENLSELPQDLAEAFESFKLAIIRHKAADWADVSAADVVSALDALKALVHAPTGHDH